MRKTLLSVALLLSLYASGQTTIPAPQPITQDSVNTQVKTTSNDAQAAAIQAAKDFGLVAADLKLLWQMIGQLRVNQLADVQALLTAQQAQLKDIQAQAEAAAQQAAQALALAKAMADYPYSNIQVSGGGTTGSLTPQIVTFTTLKPMNVWVSYGGSTVPYNTRGGGCVFAGTLAPPSPITPSTVFSFTLPSNDAGNVHGCLKLQGQDTNGTEFDHGVVY
jgi:hypothetical protein